MGADYKHSVQFRGMIGAQISQVAPVLNNWYTVLAATGRYTYVKSISFRVETANETLEVEVIHDGITSVATRAAVAGTTYLVRIDKEPSNTDVFGSVAVLDYDLDYFGHNISVRIRKTTALGAGTLRCKVIYEVD